jgi:hypothetical protein
MPWAGANHPLDDDDEMQLPRANHLLDGDDEMQLPRANQFLQKDVMPYNQNKSAPT